MMVTDWVIHCVTHLVILMVTHWVILMGFQKDFLRHLDLDLAIQTDFLKVTDLVTLRRLG